jgi:hypothetical protein
LSFFDEADEPRTVPRRRRPSGSGRRPPSDQQSIAARRAVAAVAILVVLILIVLGIHSCQVSARNSSLRDYNHNVTSLIQQSDQTGTQFFGLLSNASGTDPTSLQNQLNEARVSADSELSRARALDVPSEVQDAQQNLLLTLTLRRDGIADVAQQIQKATGSSASTVAVNQIATDMARFLASDVVYKTEVGPKIAAALHAAGIPVGPNGETIEGGQFLPDLSWLSPSFIGSKLGASSAASSSGKVAPGTHGHSLDSVSVGGTTLQTGSTNTIPASPPPTFMLGITNGGQNNESNVVVKVEISGTNITGQTTIPQTTAGQSTTANVTLPTSPPKGNYTVKVTVQPVPGEKNVGNNSLSFPVTFQ